MKQPIDFSKKIVIWALWYTSISTILWTVVYLIKGDVSMELVGLTGAVITGVVVTYSSKAGVENYQKIKQQNQYKEREENQL